MYGVKKKKNLWTVKRKKLLLCGFLWQNIDLIICSIKIWSKFCQIITRFVNELLMMKVVVFRYPKKSNQRGRIYRYISLALSNFLLPSLSSFQIWRENFLAPRLMKQVSPTTLMMMFFLKESGLEKNRPIFIIRPRVKYI